MKIIDGLKLKGEPAEIPDSLRIELPQFFVEMGYKVGAEVGIQKGLFAKVICDAGLKLFAIDPWKDYSDYHRGDNDFQKGMDDEYEQTKKLLAPYNCTIIRKTSMEAVKDFEDESLDFVYIDANHGFKYVTEDIFEWSKKVRSGGVISGHDYIYTSREFDDIHVKHVLHAYTKAFRISNWYVLGRKRIGEFKHVKLNHNTVIMESTEGEKRDKYRSWFWIKQ